MNHNSNSFQVLFTILAFISIGTVVVRFADNPVAIGIIFVLAAALIYWRVRSLRRARLGRTKILSDLDFSRLRQVRLREISVWLKKNVSGHSEIIDEIEKQLRMNLSLAKPGRCLGSFVFVGPTGTGKTFTAQLLSEAIFPDNPPVIIRMNQMKSPSDVSALIGAPPGGLLTQPVIESPFRVVVLDELEKAHKDVIDCLYNILDSASCSDKETGRLIDFSGCVIIATTNAAIEQLRDARGRNPDGDAATMDIYYREALAADPKLEKAFLARWQRIFFFDTLKEAQVAEVACKNISKYWRSFGIEVSYAAPELILQAVLKNRDFREFGVRQLMSFLRMKSDPVIEVARSQGRKSVTLELNERGEFTIRPAAQNSPWQKKSA